MVDRAGVSSAVPSERPTAPSSGDPSADEPDDGRWIVSLLIFTTLIAASVFGARPVITYVALSLGAGAAEIGLIASSFAVLAIVAAIPLGRAVDRIGERPIMIGGGLICFLVCLALPVLNSILLLAVATAFLGIGQMLAVIGAHTLLANRGPAEKRPYRIGLYTSAASLGHAMGPLLGGLIIGEAITREASTIALVGAAVMAGLAAISVLGIPAGERTRREAGTTAPAGSSIRSTLRLPGMVPALTAGIIALTAVDLLVSYLPVYGEERQITPQVVGTMLAVLFFAQMGSRLFLGRLLSRYSHAAIVIGSVAISGAIIPFLILPLGVPILLLIMTVAGLGLGLAQPMTLLWVAIVTPAADRGLAMGVRMGGNRLGQLVVPVAVGATAGQFGVNAILATVAALLLGAAGYVFSERRVLGFAPHATSTADTMPASADPDP